MSDPLQHDEHSEGDGVAQDLRVVESALAQSRDLPFFDLDIQLIRRGVPILQPAAQSSAQPDVRPQVDYPRERRALAALESLMAERQRDSAAPPVTLPVTFSATLPRTVPLSPPVPQPVQPAATAVSQAIQPRIMPTAGLYEETVSFVSPAFERVATLESQTAIAAGLLQAGQDIAAQAFNHLPDVKLQALRWALVQREALLHKAQQPLLPQTKPVQPQVNLAQTADDLADDQPHELPWGHVTYRLLVM